jgi:KUP system potassium uptake protein
VQTSKSSIAVLTLGALGVVYGDIGTSVLYALKLVFDTGLVPLTEANILGILSIFFWTLTTVVSIKYVGLVLRADNHGEGGLVAMLALALAAVKDKPRLRQIVVLVGIFGAALFYGDGVITPAISVLSAMEGLNVISPHLKPWVIPLTLLILLGLFWVQKRGTASIGKFFGPITLVWFAVIGLMGIAQITRNPQVLWALAPHHALGFMFANLHITFIVLGAVVLCVTGAEALYADMGHFGKRPIRLAWFWVVMPALVLNYFGQGALLIANPAALKNPFYLMAPEWALIPLLILAAAATVIASQALISGAYSITKQVIQMGFLPRMKIEHTSINETGQIYMPAINWGLFALTVVTVVMFKSSDALGAAYGIAVCINMLITTSLTFFVIRYGWKYPLALCIAATGLFFIVDFVFLASNLLKIEDGGWFPLLIGAVIFTLMVTWHRGTELVSDAQKAESFSLREFLQAVFVSPPLRVEGTAVFLTADLDITPNALLHNLKHNKVLHTHNLFITVRNHEVPWIGMEKRLEVHSLGNHCWQIIINFGFKNDPDVPGALKSLYGLGFDIDPMTTSYFLSRNNVVSTPGAGMAPWREKLFAQMHHNASDAADFLYLPSNAVVELGSKVEI